MVVVFTFMELNSAFSAFTLLVKNIDCWYVGVVISLERGANCLHRAQLMPLPLTAWCRLTQVILEKRSLNGCSSSSSFMELKYALLISDLHCYNCCKMCFEIWREQFVVRRMLLIKHFWSISSEITVSILELHELILWLSETAFIVVTHRTF